MLGAHPYQRSLWISELNLVNLFKFKRKQGYSIYKHLFDSGSIHLGIDKIKFLQVFIMELVCFTNFPKSSYFVFLYIFYVHDIDDCYINIRLFIINLINNLALKLVNNCFDRSLKPTYF